MSIRLGEMWRLTNGREVRVVELPNQTTSMYTVWSRTLWRALDVTEEQFEERLAPTVVVPPGTVFTVVTDDMVPTAPRWPTLMTVASTGTYRDGRIELKELTRNYSVSAFTLKADVDFTRQDARRLPLDRPTTAAQQFKAWYTDLLERDPGTEGRREAMMQEAVEERNDLLKAFRAGLAMKDEAEADAGPWSVSKPGKDGSVGIYSDDFYHDVAMRVTGDFGCPSVKYHYALRIAASLNRNYRGR